MKAEKYSLALIYAALLLGILVVGLGAFTRLTEAGLGCPDWPGCYGFLTVPQSVESVTKANQAFPLLPIETQKAWNEMIHRYIAGLLGLLIVVITFLAWRVKMRHRILSSVLLGMVVFQAALGMWTVTMKLMPIIVMAHLLGGFMIVSLLLLLAVQQRREIQMRRPKKSSKSPQIMTHKLKILSLFALGAVVLQIALGGWTSANYAAVVCTQLPLCDFDWLSNYDISAFNPISPNNESYQYGVLNVEQRVTIHVSHRLGAMLVSALVFWLALAIRKPLGNLSSFILMFALVLQIALGVTNIVALFPLPVALAHNLCALLLLLVMVRIVADIFSRKNNILNIAPS